MLLVRLGAGIVFFAHGAQKVFGWFGGPGLKATIQTFQQYMKIPPAATVLAAFIECFGGLALIVGLLARPAALGLIVVMLVAVAKVHWKNGFFLNCRAARQVPRLGVQLRADRDGAGRADRRRRRAVDRPHAAAARASSAMGFVIRVLVNAAAIGLAARLVPGIAARRRRARSCWPASCSD